VVLARLGRGFSGFSYRRDARLVVGPIDSVGAAAIGGAIAGTVIGAAQWFVLRQRLPISALWAPATGAAMALGLVLAQVLLSDSTSAVPLLLRGLVVGAVIGVAQTLLLRRVLGSATIWAVVVALAWPLGWAVTAAWGIDLTLKWAVFGSSGALTFQLVTGLTLAYLLRRSAASLASATVRTSPV
jgi:hypothetical protein